MQRRTKLIIAGAIAVFIALVATLTLLYVNVWAAPTKQDFEKAKAAVKSLGTTFDEVSSASAAYAATFSSGSSAKPDSEKTLKNRYESSVKKLAQSLDEIENMKAIRDKEVRSANNALRKKADAFIHYSNGFVTMKKSFAECNDILQVSRQTNVAKAHREASKDCLATLDALAKSKVAVFANYARTFANGVRERQKIFDSYEKTNQPTEKSVSDLKKANATLVGSLDLEALKKASQDASGARELQKLEQLLSQKITQS